MILKLGWVAGFAALAVSVPPAAAAPPNRPITAIVAGLDEGFAVTRLARLDPLSLRPQRQAEVAREWHGTWSVEPGGSRVALGLSEPGRGARVGVKTFDLERLRPLRAVETGIAAEHVTWLAPRRLWAVLQSGRLADIDPRRGIVVREHRLPSGSLCGFVPAAAETARELLLLGDPRRSPLLVAGIDGRVREVGLGRPAGSCRSTALAADPVARRAFVIGAAGRAAEVSLPGLRVAHRRLPRSRLPDTATRHWEAQAAGARRVALTRVTANGRAGGVELADLGARTRRVLDARAVGAVRAGGLLLTFGRRGVSGHTLRGRRTFTLLRSRRIGAVEVSGGFAYAFGARRLWVIDLRARRVLRADPNRARGEVFVVKR